MDRNGRLSRGMLPLAFLAAEYYSLPWKPPVTASLVAANTLVYLRPAFLRPIIPHIEEVWFNPHRILKHRDVKRFLLSPFYHVGDPHLLYNMMSLLWKGVQLETSMGSVEFASMVATLLVLSQGITLLLAKSLVLFYDYDRPFYSEYSVGFSGVLFALKVVLNSQSEGNTFVHGLLVPARHAAWAELFLVQMLVPGVSFLGHLGGILAGILYVKLRGFSSRLDPFTPFIKAVAGALCWPLRSIASFFNGGRRRRILSGVWRCQACTFDNPDWLTACEICGTHHDGSRSSSSRHQQLALEELRRRRINRFDS